MKNKIEFIAFDADDTLWENELYFQELEHKFCHLLRKYSPAPSVSEELFKTEIKNLHIYGYGLKGMLLCMIETICKVTNGEGDLNLVKEILRSGQELLQRPITLLDGVQEVISALHENYKLVLATKGDLFDQKRKISASGLQEYFCHIEIMSDKKNADYKRLLDHLGCARRFARGGYDLIITGRNTGKLEILKKELEAEGVQVLALAFDVRNREAARKAVDYIPQDWRNIDVLINNAGLARGLEPEYQGSFEDWDQMIDTNIKGLLTMTRLIVPGMVRRNHGHIINIGSVAGDAAYAGGNVYCATKAAVKAITDGLRIDVAHTKVRVTNVKPGLVETNFSNVRFHGDNQRAASVYQGIEPLNGDDIADVAFYAASAPEHVQIAEVLVLATHQANGTVIHRD